MNDYEGGGITAGPPAGSKSPTDVRDVLGHVRYLDMRRWASARGIEPGDYRSKILGDEIEFAEIREYVAGDDVRRIDWNVSARYNDPYVKQFADEMDLNVYVIIDMSDSVAFGSAKSKRDIITEIGASLVVSALRNNNRIGLGLFAGSFERFVPARKGRRHAMKLIHEMLSRRPAPGSGTDIAGSLSELARRIKRRSVVFLISDFVSRSFVRPLRLISYRHTTVMIGVSDAHERRFPDIGYVCLEDAETGSQILVNTSTREFQDAYAAAGREAEDNNRMQAVRAGADYIQITGEEHFENAFNRHAKMTRGRRQGGMRSYAV